MLKPFLKRVVEGRDLSRREAGAAMEIIMDGAAADAQIAAFTVALRMKGESAGEIAGFARAMRERAIPFPASGADLVDTCGTGGDGLSTPNVSTLAALVAAGAGLRIAKHGNRSATSRCGSADLLERLGVAIDLPPEEAARTLERAGIVFLFAPAYHPALRYAAAARKAIGVRSFWNLLGPLCNPARAEAAVIGVADGSRVALMAAAARSLGIRRALVVHGSDGMDELTLAGPSRCARLEKGRIRNMTVTPARAGLKPRAGRVGRGGDPDRNARVATEILGGRRGAARDLVVLNAAAVLEIGGAARDLREGAALAAESLDRGAAAAKLEALR